VKPFVRTLLIILVITFIVDKLFYFSLNHLPKQQYDKRLEKIITGELDKDIIILGSSRAARNILAEEIESKTRISSFNLGFPGSDIDFHSFLLKSLIDAGTKPRIVLLVLDPVTFKKSELTFRMDKLYPLMKYDAMNKVVCTRDGKSTFFSKISIAYRVRENFPMNYFRWKPDKFEVVKENGSMPLEGKSELWNPDTFNYSYFSQYDSSDEAEIYQNIINDIVFMCRNNNIKLIYVYPPNFAPFQASFVDRVQNLTSDSIPSIIYDLNDSIYHKVEYFYDGGHLNTAGAKIYTNEIIKSLKELVY